MGEMLKDIGKGSPLENLQLHRTKCSNIIKNIIEPCLKSELIKEVGDRPYSIILDESTDVSSEKYMAYMIRYYNTTQKAIVTDFLGFQELYHTTAAALYTAFTEFMKEMSLNLTNLIAIGTDGASNLTGHRNSLYTHLKAEYPQVQLLKCVCHSLSLCAAKACEELPSSLEYLLRETRNWFAHSPLRLKTYQYLYKSLNSDKKPPKLTQLSATRWLAFHAAVDSNIKQWNALKLHFNNIAATGEKCYLARELAGMYNDETHLLYLVFLSPLLKDVTDVNIIFQANNANITKIYDDLRILLLATARRVFKPASLRAAHAHDQQLFTQNIESVKSALAKAKSEFENSLLSVENIDFGSSFKSLAQQLPANKTLEVQKRCTGVLVKLCQEIVNRLPANVNIVQNLSAFDVQNTLSIGCVNKPLPWELAPSTANKSEIERQRRLISNYTSADISEEDIVTPEKMWITLLEKKNAGGQYVCRELAEFALRSLSLPISNATVERVFSIMNIVKSKMRNRMQLPMMQAITRIRLHFSVRKICCNTFRPTDEMIKMHNSKMYQRTPIDAAGSSTSSTASRNEDSSSEIDGEVLQEVIVLLQEDHI